MVEKGTTLTWRDGQVQAPTISKDPASSDGRKQSSLPERGAARSRSGSQRNEAAYSLAKSMVRSVDRLADFVGNAIFQDDPQAEESLLTYDRSHVSKDSSSGATTVLRFQCGAPKDHPTHRNSLLNAITCSSTCDVYEDMADDYTHWLEKDEETASILSSFPTERTTAPYSMPRSSRPAAPSSVARSRREVIPVEQTKIEDDLNSLLVDLEDEDTVLEPTTSEPRVPGIHKGKPPALDFEKIDSKKKQELEAVSAADIPMNEETSNDFANGYLSLAEDSSMTYHTTPYIHIFEDDQSQTAVEQSFVLEDLSVYKQTQSPMNRGAKGADKGSILASSELSIALQGVESILKDGTVVHDNPETGPVAVSLPLGQEDPAILTSLGKVRGLSLKKETRVGKEKKSRGGSKFLKRLFKPKKSETRPEELESTALAREHYVTAIATPAMGKEAIDGGISRLADIDSLACIDNTYPGEDGKTIKLEEFNDWDSSAIKWSNMERASSMGSSASPDQVQGFPIF